MKPIFISYSSKYRDLTRQLAAALEGQYGAGSVWWDHELESWGDYEVQIRNAINEARVVVVIWSKAAGESDWVKSEAGRANRARKLVNVRPPDTVWEDVPSPYDQHHVNELGDIPGILRSVQAVWEGRQQPTAVPLHEIYFRHHGERLIDPKQQTPPVAMGSVRPTELLQAKFAAVQYSDVTGMREVLLDWCADTQRVSAGRLIHGAGGLGKTRLMIDVAAELRRQGWIAGFLNRAVNADEATLKQRWQAIEQIIAHGEDNGLLLVIDYAESRREEVVRLTQLLLTQEAHAQRRMRFVLLARGAGAWWHELIDEKPEVHWLFRDGEGGIAASVLPGIVSAEQRLRFFRHSLENFASALRTQGVETATGEPRADRLRRIASGEGFSRPLAVQMEALLHLTSATPAAPGIHAQLRAVLGLEHDHWTKLLGSLDGERRRDMDRGVAQVTAINGVAARPAAERLLMADGFYKGKRAARVDVDPVYRNLSVVYAAGDGGLVPLEPDLVGEHQVATIGDEELIDGSLNWIESEPETEREKRRRDLLTVLQRASFEDHGALVQERARQLLQHLVKTRFAFLAADIIAVLIETPGALEGIVIEQIAASGDEALSALDSAVPRQSLALMDVSLAVSERRAQLARIFCGCRRRSI